MIGFNLFLGHVTRSNRNCHGSDRLIKVRSQINANRTTLVQLWKFDFFFLLRAVSALYIPKASRFISFNLLQSLWHIPSLWSRWCCCYSELPTTWFPSPRRARRWKSHLWAMLSCLSESQFEVWCGRSSLSSITKEQHIRWEEKMCRF